MESSGEGGRVQITETSKILLENEYPEFIIEIRGINKDVVSFLCSLLLYLYRTTIMSHQIFDFGNYL